MRIRPILALIMAAILLMTCGCAPSAPTGGDKPDAEIAKENREARQIYLTLWSWQIPTAETAAEYAQKAKDSGFTAIDFAVLWANFEPLEGHFDWAYLDSVVAAFTAAGLKISLQPLLWTKDLAWAEDLELQEMESRKDYSVDGRGSFVSFPDAETRKIVENTLQNFALHAAGYGENLTRWGVRLSCFGEFDYSVNEDLDYSGAFVREFYDYLKDVYGSWQKLSDARGLTVASREDLDAMAYGDVVEACYGDWRRFRQDRLLDLLDSVTAIFRSADPEVPILFPLGTFGNGMNVAYSGVVDLWTAVGEADVDILGLSFCDGAEPGMMLALASSVTTKKIAVEVDGAWALEEGRDVAAQVKICGTYKVFSLSTANFTTAQLDAHKATLTQYPALFSQGDALGECDPTKGILILSNAVVATDPPKSYDALYRDLWLTMSENGARRVRFVTEGQVASGDVTLEGVTALYAGNINGSVPVSRAFADAFSATGTSLIGKISFVSVDGTPFPDDLKTALAARVTAE